MFRSGLNNLTSPSGPTYAWVVGQGRSGRLCRKDGDPNLHALKHIRAVLEARACGVKAERPVRFDLGLRPPMLRIVGCNEHVVRHRLYERKHPVSGHVRQKAIAVVALPTAARSEGFIVRRHARNILGSLAEA